MKVIKQMKQQTHNTKLYKFFRQTPLLTRIVIPLILIASLFAFILDINKQLTIFSIIIVFPFSQIVLFTVLSISDIRRQEHKGTVYFIINFILGSVILFGLNLLYFQIIPQEIKSIGIVLSKTSIPLQYLIMITVVDAIQNPNGRKHIFCQPLYLKAIFYPFVIFFIIQIMNIRGDIFIPIILAPFLHFILILKGITILSRKIDNFVGQNALRIGFIRTGNPQINLVTVQNLATSNSIVLQEK